MAEPDAETEAEVDPTTALERFLAEQRYKCNRLFKEDLSALGDPLTKITKRDFNVENKNGVQIRLCPPYFDGLLCWPHTNASKTATLPCPPNAILGYDMESSKNHYELNSHSTAIATKSCLADGQWYKNSEEISWSNYSLCGSSGELTTRYVIQAVTDLGVDIEQSQDYEESESSLFRKWLPIIRTISQIGYASSFTMLVIAMIIFSLLRKLRNPRNRLHMHLFASFIMRAFMALLKDWIFVDGVGLAWDIILVDGRNAFIKERNTWICKAITSTWQYFIVANYSWILIEGLYLHNLVFLAFCADTAAITLYTLMGWGLPVFVVVPWIIIRATFEDTLCWTTHQNPSFFLVIRIPIIISILFNFLLFINIVRVLFVKFKTSVHLQRKKMQYRWAKSTLVLMPLFGAHYTLFLGLSYHKDHRVELIWLFCDQLFASFQGSFVALLYCLLNFEVRMEIRRAWRARWTKNSNIWVSGSRESRKREGNRRRRSHDYDHPTLTDTPLRNMSVLQTDKTSNEFRPNVLESEVV